MNIDLKELLKCFGNIKNKEEAKLFLKHIKFSIFLETLKCFNFYEKRPKKFYLKYYLLIKQKCKKIIKKNYMNYMK